VGEDFSPFATQTNLSLSPGSGSHSCPACAQAHVRNLGPIFLNDFWMWRGPAWLVPRGPY
jgi:hypothetical protein